ncbi:MAG: four helix bundle protein [Anaerolineae bacterium]|nr:MAG: four helix bundle protein [Anaerolineae bacterium]
MNQYLSYRDLIVWQQGIKLSILIYKLTEAFPNTELYGLTSQIRRSAVSIPSNIAEGQARKSPGEFRHFLRIALGSIAELDTQLIIAKELGYVPESDFDDLTAVVVEIQKMIYGLINSLN